MTASTHPATTPYEPPAGSVPARVIALLDAREPGAEIPARVLADMLEIPAQGMTALLDVACRRGALRRRKAIAGNRLQWHYRLGDGTPEPLPEDHVEDRPLHATAERPQVQVRPGPLFPTAAADAPDLQDEEPAPQRPVVRGPWPVRAEPESAEQGVEQPLEADAWLSCCTGAIVLTGLQPDEEGQVTIPPQLVQRLRTTLAWAPIPIGAQS